MLNVTFIGRDFHRESGSAEFFLKILYKYFKVEKIYPDSYDEYKFDGLKYGADHIFFVWQSEHISFALSNLGYRVINVSMFDGVENRKNIFFEKLKNCININFSKNLHYKFINLNLNSNYLKYYPETKSSTVLKIKNSVFFWERDVFQISCEDVIQRLGSTFNFNLHGINQERKTEILEKFKNHEICFSNRIESKGDFLQFLAKFEFFVAPRLTEGIGMSFLDAMSVGCIPVGVMNPTFSEYVESSLNGFELSSFSTSLNKITDLEFIRSNIRNDLSEGANKFAEDIDLLINSIKLNFLSQQVSIDFYADKQMLNYILQNFHRPDHCMDLMDR